MTSNKTDKLQQTIDIKINNKTTTNPSLQLLSLDDQPPCNKSDQSKPQPEA